MTDPPKSTSLPSDDMHWGISYLREDVQDVKHDVRDLRNYVQGEVRALRARIDSRFAVLLTAMIALAGIIIGANFAFLQFFLPH